MSVVRICLQLKIQQFETLKNYNGKNKNWNWPKKREEQKNENNKIKNKSKQKNKNKNKSKSKIILLTLRRRREPVNHAMQVEIKFFCRKEKKRTETCFGFKPLTHLCSIG